MNKTRVRLVKPGTMALAATAAAVVITAAFCATPGASAAPLYNAPDYLTTRDVLLEPVPYPYGRPRIVSRNHPAAPDFLVQATVAPIYTRTPYDRIWGREPGPAWYGAPNRVFALSFARVGQVAIPFDPFDSFDDGEVVAELEIARNLWLMEHQLVGAARLVRRVDLRSGADFAGDEADAADTAAALPQPRAIIKLERHPGGVAPATPRPEISTEDLPLQARRLGPNHVEIISANLIAEREPTRTGELVEEVAQKD